MAGKIRIFSGNAHENLALKICKNLSKKLGKRPTDRFADGEIWVKLSENVRGEDVFIIQPTFPPAENLLELLLLIDAAKRASASRVTAVIPYFGYARQDKKDEPRMPISAKLISNLISTAGADRVLTMDLHADQIQGYFDVPVDHLFAAPVFAQHVRRTRKNLKRMVVVSPDLGGAKRARHFANRLGRVGVAVIEKQRPRPNVSATLNVIGTVREKDCLLLDDILDTGGTVVSACAALKEAGAREIFVYCVHPLLSKDAVKKIIKGPIDDVVVTDTIPLRDGVAKRKFNVVSVSRLLSEAIRRIHENRSVSSLFK
ncbi:ribose-phosphate pyrophosphokinase [candidate division TA06 bacterium]|uniref:Ribose-phosphate pyrophosphokinase n=1 Tax=candidate division TA06 bacterium TaxID=2250710 RepID=A0A523XLI4_UNCT6|nr:MAG: ribose-phosphate pyrophosphokinase [candidate division TA06 bacterium]